ncbi:RING finger protein 10 isoform X2 [Leptopilina heterotoma]|uniref:RING finger protein 10 isoform X2 n=1 Tax=Leptopilina heterotoma TaxID=63436 RepID=UPI001CA84C18|nr:RING finger protein 10 isoform X2 [Leptopilina heterotoma]
MVQNYCFMSQISQFATSFNIDEADVVSRPFPKSSRKREPIGASNFSKYDQPRKSFAQKGKGFDKRPKFKGHYNGGPKEDSKVVEELAEPGSVMNQGSKKQNLNHLLNFHYAPRDMRNGSDTWNRRRSSNFNHNSNRWLPPVQRHKYNKEQFLQANCQFIVNANADYTVNLADPDTLVEWKFIEQIRLHTSDKLSCPICLCSPVAGKMTRCGHVYCWACILHYLALSDKTWRKCPICYESIHKSDLKSVVEIEQNVINVGDNVKLRLMRRERGSLIATSVPEKEIPAPTAFFSVSDNFHCQIYSKLLLANVDNIMDIIECEKVQLKLELQEDPHCPENCFIDQALNELEIRERELLMEPKISQAGLELKKDDVNKCQEMPKTEDVQETTGNGCEENVETDNKIDNHDESNEEIAEVNNDTESQFEIVKSWWDGEEYELLTSQNDSNHVNSFKPPKQMENHVTDLFTSSNAQKFFYFYQAENGQHVYLHAMNAKMLEMEYGSLEHCPRTIMGKLLEKEEGSLTEDLRRRLRYLCHLPLTCQFEIAEIELLPPLVSQNVLQQFHDQLDTRQRKRHRKDREERKREKKINEEENKRMGKFPTRKVHIESRRHFPQWQPDSTQTGVSIPSPPESTAPSSVASSPSLTPFEEVSSSLTSVDESLVWPSNNADSGPSFAQMLRQNGQRSGNSWPSIKTRSNPPPENQPPIQQVVDDDGYVSLRNFNPTFGDALAQALEQSSLVESAVERSEENSGGGKKKKKKNKPTVLFATGMARAS